MIKVTRLQKMLAVLAVCCIAMGLLLLAGSPPGVYAEGSAEPNYSITHSMRVGRQEGAAANGTFEGYLHTLWSDADGDVTETGTGSHVYFAEGGENFYVRSIDCGAYMVYNFDVSPNVSAAEMKFYIGKTWKVSFAVGPRTVWDGKTWQKAALPDEWTPMAEAEGSVDHNFENRNEAQLTLTDAVKEYIDQNISQEKSSLYVKIEDATPADGNGPCVSGIDLRLTYAAATLSLAETQMDQRTTMLVGTSETAAADGSFAGYVHEMSEDAGYNGGSNVFRYRFFDELRTAVYTFPVDEIATDAIVDFYVGGQYRIEAAYGTGPVWNGQAWEKGEIISPFSLIANAETPKDYSEGNRDTIYVRYDASALIAQMRKEDADYLFFRIGDETRGDGNGGTVHKIEVHSAVTAPDLQLDSGLAENETIMQVGVKETEDDIFEGYFNRKEGEGAEGGWNVLNESQNLYARFFDADKYGEYVFPVDASARQTVIDFWVGGQYEVSIAAGTLRTKVDGKWANGVAKTDWTVIARCYTQANLDTNVRTFSYDATDFIAQNITEESPALLIRIADAKKDDGWGGSVHKIAVRSAVEKQSLSFGEDLILNVDVLDGSTIFSENQSVVSDHGTRFMDNDRYLTYKIEYPAANELSGAYFYARVTGNDRYVRISTDGSNFEDLLYIGKDSKDGADYINENEPENERSQYYFDLMEYLSPDQPTDIYIWFGDKNPADGYGSDLWNVRFFRQPKNTVPEDPDGSWSSVTRAMASDEQHIVEKQGMGRETGSVFFDGTNYGIYRFDLTHADLLGLQLGVDMRSGYFVSVSADGSNWTQIAVADIRYNIYREENYNVDGGNDKTYVFDISFLLEKPIDCVYVRLGDNTEETGYGGSYRWLGIREIYRGTGSANLLSGDLITEVDLSASQLLAQDGGSVKEGLFRSVQGNAWFSYKLELPATADTLSLAMKANNAVRLEISFDGTAFEQVPGSLFLQGSEYADGTGYSVYLTDYLQRGKTIWLRFSAAAQEGPAVTIERLLVFYNDSAVRNENDKYYAEQDYQIWTDTAIDEADYAVVISEAAGESKHRRFFDETAYGVYRFTVKEGATGVKLIGTVGNSYLIEVSPDGENWTQLAVAPVQVLPTGENPYAGNLHLNFDITSLILKDGNRTVYVRVSDSVDDNGNGGLVLALGIMSYAGEEVSAPEYSDPTPPQADGEGCGGTLYGLALLPAAAIVGAAVVSAAIKRRKTK